MGNPSKQKSLHALALTPAAEMDVKELQQKPADTTPSPYQAALLKKRAADDANLGVQVCLLTTPARTCRAGLLKPFLLSGLLLMVPKPRLLPH